MIVCDRFFTLMKTFSDHPDHALIDRQRGAACHQVGPPGQGGVDPLEAAVVDGQHVVLDRFLHEEGLHLLELLRVLGGQVVRQAEVRPGVVQLPRVILGGSLAGFGSQGARWTVPASQPSW